MSPYPPEGLQSMSDERESCWIASFDSSNELFCAAKSAIREWEHQNLNGEVESDACGA